MYSVITQGNFASPVFPYIYLGSAFYIYVGNVLGGLCWAVIDDREHYKTLKYVYTAPIQYPVYLLGRGVARILIATVSVFITILFGQLFLSLNIDFAAVDWPLFFTALLIGLMMLALLGLILAGFMLLVAQHIWDLGGAVAGALYLFSGAIFPLEVLPPFLRPLGYIMPVTYWLELLRRALVGNIAAAFPTLAGLSNVQLLGILISLSLVFGGLSIFLFRWCVHTARERGLLDMVTNY
jgi:ABC-2 type transport system permease protein